MKTLFVPVLMSAIGFAAIAEAQQTFRQSDQRSLDSYSEPDRHGQGDESDLDKRIATTLVLASKEQAKISKMAGKRSESDDVEKFADDMAEAHEERVKQLRQFAHEAARGDLEDDESERSRDDSRRVGSRSSDDRSGRFEQRSVGYREGSESGRGQSNDENWADFERSAAKERLKLMKRELEDEDGKAFDKAYVGQQIGAHIALLADLRAAKDIVSSELRRDVASARDDVRDHLEDAKKLMEDLQ